MPLPNWAILPEIFRSVSTVTTVRVAVGAQLGGDGRRGVARAARVAALGVDDGRWSASSFSTNLTVPAYSDDDRPDLHLYLARVDVAVHAR